ncbi:hypothetical protein COU78_01475 [Candidatus Peregrinibacteria bacterium CG10_big_fil_rev_8_21_14_0_10_49_24]|nr:MAG: hypothetical protein COV83_04440 [Candidatus Peregrinibacteria bacterium CG11_big_fil_rev_8_21_14_0_20_49_14]PIR51395.1 MAG: hypothetical protein COU78_01475 [Candidatus Peregrinibacteria bacterium CG10_big_fil_rev_8_21_14_0_10_49_24]PJA68159.1 MAG: hypothetical protein CO157_01290 [Candidatus Peregrinibacteria bacterium CG_4_9_14_3_um_filter_49_12]
MRRFSQVSAAVLMVPLLAGTALASLFPDVPATHIHYKEIDSLVNAGVINGNPDGTFDPAAPVNRAAFLKMLYKAKGKEPDPTSVRCFKDVIPDSWYEPFVCDAAANRYVDGYPDGNFRPAQAVKRVEALKMITTVFDIEVDEIDALAKEIVNFVDISTSAWYTVYLYTAFNKGILPIPGQDGARFYPDKELLRSEAAAYIYNALNVEIREARQQPVTQSSSASANNDDTSDSGQSGSAQSSASDSTEVAVSFPFERSGKFTAKRPYAFVFDIGSPTTAYIKVDLATSGKVSCRLYLLASTGFSDEYFLGHQEGNSCYIHAALNPGAYQLQLQPTVADATFSVEASVKAGDGNDGFREALGLPKNTPRSAVLEVNDIQDWYSFVVRKEETMTLDITNALEIDCIVYAMKDVDLYGFSGPSCGQSYLYPPGTYFVAIGRSIASKASQKTYTIQLR